MVEPNDQDRAQSLEKLRYELRDFVRESIDKSRRRTLNTIFAWIGVIGVIVSIASFFGLNHLVVRKLTDYTDEFWKDEIFQNYTNAIDKLHREAEEASKEIVETKTQYEELTRKSEILVVETGDKIRSIRNEIGSARIDLEDELKKDINALKGDIKNMRKILVYDYEFTSSRTRGKYQFRTPVSTRRYPTAIIGSWDKSGDGCQYEDAGDYFMDDSEDNWILKIHKNEECTDFDIQIVFVPDALIRDTRSRRNRRLERIDE